MKNHHIVHSFGFALQGVKHSLKENRNLGIHFFMGTIALLLGVIFQLTRFEMITIMIMTVIVISAEMINTSIEEMTDLITTEHRQEAKIAKDVSAGMVLVSSIGAAIVGTYIFFPYLLEIIGF
jgi:diacylglycerol kinase (ATP)